MHLRRRLNRELRLDNDDANSVDGDSGGGGGGGGTDGNRGMRGSRNKSRRKRRRTTSRPGAGQSIWNEQELAVKLAIAHALELACRNGKLSVVRCILDGDYVQVNAGRGGSEQRGFV
jgi:hypothetical protein